MRRDVGRWALLLGALTLVGGWAARAQIGINPKALEDLKGFTQKFEEGDTLFADKKYVDAAAALAAGHALYIRASKRDDGVFGYDLKLKGDTFPALRRYGYGFGPNASLTEEPTGEIKATAKGLHNALINMWQDATILGGVEKGPKGALFDDPPVEEFDEERVDRVIGEVYGPVSQFDLPVKDNEWRDVVLWSRRAHLLVEYGLQKYPAWKAEKRRWSRNNANLNMTGDEALADVKAKLTEAEPEYQKIVADFKNAEPKGVVFFINDDLETLTKAIAGVKQNGWVDWVLARDLYISKDFLDLRKKRLLPAYAAEGKTFPPDKMKPIEAKVAELMSAIESSAAKWKFPAGKPHDAAIEARAKGAVLAKFPGGKVLNSALDGDWTILKNDIGLPRYRTRPVLVLVQIPGQKHPWLIRGGYDQTYTGGGTFNSAGTFAPPYIEVRIQGAN